MRDDRTARLQQLLSREPAFPGQRPGLLGWLGQLLDAHPGADGYDQVERLLQFFRNLTCALAFSFHGFDLCRSIHRFLLTILLILSTLQNT
ncbi:hypothetical protein A3K88_07775 [Pseudomonas putida]|uniref:Uncharacterized protein n=1 Tax=Pseudomonas plecoglossicida TaxID=70775 RepID=A0ABX4TUU9_PSEDL|nr:hypothetical protein A3K88_07775 [Pseudomonas putida]PLU85341.1 hypothetical protein CXG44_21250 [Pseudomonas plecoglossicida]PPB16734.1 hypothetical protein HV87_19535 [Pseudomonas aeruginosa]PLU90261.1 hypothetical protein CXG45_24070 [Pseudomonas plecoglossicida]PLV02674.1 hypothetical protein CXG48_15280 [Pseudomonas plecoglossicida]